MGTKSKQGRGQDTPLLVFLSSVQHPQRDFQDVSALRVADWFKDCENPAQIVSAWRGVGTKGLWIPSRVAIQGRKHLWPGNSPIITIPPQLKDFSKLVLIYFNPYGTGRQQVPLGWGVQQLPGSIPKHGNLSLSKI